MIRREDFKRSLIVIAALVLLAVASLGASAEPTTIYMVAETTESHFRAQQAVADMFHATHPDIQIEFVHLTSLVNQMLTMVAGDVPLDIGYMDPWVAVEWGRQGLLEDLAPYLERDPQLVADIPQPFFDLTTVEGKVYGLPMDAQAGTIMYNIDAYNESGVAVPSANWTYEDLKENARRLTKHAPDGEIVRHGFRIPTGRNWVPAIWAFGGDLLDSWTNPTRFTGNSDATINALSYYNDMVNLDAVQDWDSHRALGTTPQFLEQNVAMLQTNTFAFATVYGYTDFQWDVLPLPAGPAGRAGFINAHQRFLFSGSKHKAEAWEVMRFFATEEARIQRVRTSGSMPVHLSIIRDEWLNLPGVPSRHLLLDDLPTARSPWPVTGNIWNSFARDAEAVIWGRQPVSTAIENMEQLATAAIREYREGHGLQ